MRVALGVVAVALTAGTLVAIASRAGRIGTNGRRIKVAIRNRRRCVPESIVLRTAFRFEDADSYRALETVQERFLGFLRETGLVYEGPHDTQVYAAFPYRFPAYDVQLNRHSYRQFKAYQRQNPGVEGMATTVRFSQQDQTRFAAEVLAKARSQAQQIASGLGLSLGSEYEMMRVEEAEGDWKVYPPFSAQIDHFQQCMEGEYKFVFIAR